MMQPMDTPRPEQQPAQPLLTSAHGLLTSLGDHLAEHGKASAVAADDLALCLQALANAQLSPAAKDAAGEVLPLEFAGDLAKAITSYSNAKPDDAEFIRHFQALLPFLRWRSRQAQGDQDPHFVSRHRNALLIGPGAPVGCATLTLGVSLLQPHVAYPFHQHPPAEFYLVLSAGQWFRADAGWWTPGIDGVVFNPGNCLHAMQSQEQPLLALWGLMT